MPGDAQILVFTDFPSEGERIEQTLRTISDRAVRTAIDPETALGMVGTDTPEIVFTHLRAGAVASTCFLNEVWTRNPQSTRFLLGDSTADADTLLRCALGPHQFIPAPIDPEKLDAALGRAESIKNFVQNENIRQVISRMRTLPSRPALSIEVMRELRSSKASASAVGELVSRDVAISTKLIQMANSAFYSPEQQVSTPVEAVLLLGLETTAALVLSIETFARLDKLKPLYFSMDRVWKHSQSVADLARKICQMIDSDAETSAHVYTAGLLHDIGKLALAQNFGEDYERILKDAEQKCLPLHQLEEESFGATHAETGAYLLALWGMPLPIVEAVAGHHCSSDRLSSKFSAVTALRLADQLVNAPEKLKNILAEYPRELGLSPRLDEFNALLGNHEARPAKQREADGKSKWATLSEPTLESNIRREIPGIPNETLGQREFYIRCGRIVALVALLVVIGLFFWPQTVPLAKIQVRAKAFARQVSAKAEAAEKTDPLKKTDDGGRLEPPFALEQSVIFELVPPEQPPVPEQTPELKQAETITPTRPETDPAARLLENLKLQAIMYAGAKSSLVINGLLLHLGDLVEGWQVIAVHEHEVAVQNGVEQRILTLKSR
jgi:putative nucleotidyltransferase with HDIG domain